MVREIRIRAFRAIDDYETCEKFYEGHRKVLENHGISMVTTNNVSWAHNPSVYVVVVETTDDGRLLGGARVHVADGIEPLPLEDATAPLDPRIHDVVRNYARRGTGELGGLWNSREVAGYGIGSLFPLRAAISICQQINIRSLFFLCSPLTVRFVKWVGSRIITEVGNQGMFYYPKLDLLATAVVLEDSVNLPNAMPREKDKILEMKEKKTFIVQEKSPFKNATLKVFFELEVNAEPLKLRKIL